MFCRRNRAVQVEITTPISVSHSPPITPKPDQRDTTVGQAKRFDADLTFKFATFFIVVMQAAMIVWGYLELAAYYEQFGIRTSELELGTPTLLVYGYSYLFSGLMSAVDRFPVFGSFIPGGVFVIIGAAATALFLAMHGARSIRDMFQGGALGGVALLLVFLAPAVAVRNGVERAGETYEAETNVKAPLGMTREHTIVTEQKETLTGRLIVADTKASFIQVKDMVYKVDNSSNRVMRKVLLKPKLQAKEKKSLPPEGDPSTTNRT